MQRTKDGVSAALLWAFLQAVLASGSVEVRPSINPSKVGDTVTLSLTPPLAVSSGSWAVGDSLILTWVGDQQAVFPSHSGRVSLDPQTGALTLTAVSAADSGHYKVKGSDPVLQAGASITVLELVSNVTVSADPPAMNESEASAVLLCSVSSGSSLSFHWLNGSAELQESDRVRFSDGGSNLTVANVSRYDRGPFTCNASNALSYGFSPAVNLSIIYGPDTMTLTVKGQNSSFPIGSNLTMVCSAQSNPPAQLAWAFRGELLNASGPMLELRGVGEAQSGPYSCLAFNNQSHRNSSLTKNISVGEPSTSGSEQQVASVRLLPLLSLAAFFFTF